MAAGCDGRRRVAHGLGGVNVGGSGGGFSTIERRPAYQYDVPGIGEYSRGPVPDADGLRHGQRHRTWSSRPSGASTPSRSVTSGYSGGRALPDLSADADPYSGYLLYEPSAVAVGEPALQGGWGGTSFVAPQLNGSTAVIDSYLGHRVGFWNPSIYAFATSGSSPFTPLDAVGTEQRQPLLHRQPRLGRTTWAAGSGSPT